MTKFVPKPGETIDRTHPAIGTPKLIDWVKSQGLDPNVVETIWVGPDLELTVWEYMLDENGRKYLDSTRRNEPARRPVYRQPYKHERPTDAD